MKVIIVILSFIVIVSGWSAGGHEITAAIAQTLISSHSQNVVQYLLKEWNGNMSAVAPWADTIREEPEWQFTSRFHYSNTPDNACNHLISRDCRDLQCVVGAIMNYTNLLRSRTRFQFTEQRDFLRLLIHFVGDMHCPMHLGTTIFTIS